MDNIQYYVVVDKSTTFNIEDEEKINKVEVEFIDTKLPFSEKTIDTYLISNDKNECERYIKNLNKDIQKYFHIEQVGSEIQYTAFIDILGFSNYIKTEITNDYQAEEFYDNFNEVIEYLKHEEQNEFAIEKADYLNDIKLRYSWISDTFVVSLEYMNEIEKNDENIIKGMMIFKLSMIIASIHHFMASKFGLIVRGAVSSKYSCITDNFILGEGVAEASKLEKEIAIYPRVVFEENIISDEIHEIITREYQDNDLNFISKDCDGYYFVNYLAMLQNIPPMIGKMFKIPDDKIKKTSVKQKINVIEKYQKIVANGFKIPNEKVKAKYTWLTNYLGRVLLKEKFQKNIINN
ncbi:MAG: hypothetical protein GQ570_14405 [Helicobacteraceae bacterium]|nr:hypothetical protein [Helicobacteraceae bacterium]